MRVLIVSSISLYREGHAIHLLVFSQAAHEADVLLRGSVYSAASQIRLLDEARARHDCDYVSAHVDNLPKSLRDLAAKIGAYLDAPTRAAAS
jgi:hypothetical protein